MALELDKNLNLKTSKFPIMNLLRRLLFFLVISFSLALVYYAVFSMLINTDTEKRLSAENKEYQRRFGEMEKRRELLSDVVDGIVMKDNSLYNDIFHTTVPIIDPISSLGFIRDVADTVSEVTAVRYAAERLDSLEGRVSAISSNIQRILDAYNSNAELRVAPAELPIKDLSYIQVGASMGGRINPFYKVETRHNGVDLIAPQGEPVYATQEGTVITVKRSVKAEGNVVEIQHEGGYVTRYCHLGDIYVKKGGSVKTGQKIALIGMSGASYAPHLHYEILKDGEYIDPVSCFFASVSIREYADMLYMASSTRQSLD